MKSFSVSTDMCGSIITANVDDSGNVDNIYNRKMCGRVLFEENAFFKGTKELDSQIRNFVLMLYMKNKEVYYQFIKTINSETLNKYFEKPESPDDIYSPREYD